jgi:hypothetical protein
MGYYIVNNNNSSKPIADISKNLAKNLLTWKLSLISSKKKFKTIKMKDNCLNSLEK